MPTKKLSGFFRALLANKKLLIVAGGGILIVVGIAYFLTRGIGEVDKTPPEIGLTSPTSEEWYAAEESKLTIEGLAIDKSGIKSVAWETDKGKSGSATVSDKSWSASDVPLSQGDNKVTITAVDNKGNSSSLTLNVVYNPGVTFYDITLSQDYIYKGQSAVNITVRGGVEALAGKTISKIALYKVTNETKTQVVAMLDNGMVANGDDIPADNIYGGIYGFSSETLDQITLRIGASVGNDIFYSGIVPLRVLELLTEEEFSEILSTNTEINNKFEEIKGAAKTPKAAAQEMAQWLSERSDVEIAGTSEDGFGVWWKDKETGLLMGISNPPEGKKGRKQINKEALKRSQQGTVKGLADIKITPIRFGGAKPVYAAVGSPEVKSTKAIYLGPYLNDFGTDDDYHHGWKTILAAKCPDCQELEKKDTNVTVEHFKTLSNYGLIVISSHGDTWFKGVFGTAGGKVITHTSQKITAFDRLYYLADLLLGRLAIDARDNTLVVLPSFIKRYNGTFPNSLVYLSTCRSSYNFSMASAYLSKGAKAFFGYSDYVWASYAGKVGKAVAEDFLNNNKTAGEAWVNATNTHGANDGDGSGYAPAWFDIWGNTNLKMGGKELQNAGFEDKLIGWDAAGDARIITSLASLKPQEGKRMLIISTGLGAVTDSISSVSQTLCTKEGKLSVSFKYEFVSEEPMEYYGSAFDDYFTATIYINDTPTVLVRRSINNSTWTPIGGINFAGGDSTTYHTGWRTVTKTLGTVKQGDSVKIDLKVGDKGDSIYDSAALIDDVKLEVK